MSDMLFAGLDVSTQGTKLVVIDTETSKVVFVGAVNYDTDLPQYNTKNGVIQNQEEGVSESDPVMWIEAVNTLFKKAKAAGIPLGQVKCISVSGQQHGLRPDARAVRPVVSQPSLDDRDGALDHRNRS